MPRWSVVFCFGVRCIKNVICDQEFFQCMTDITWCCDQPGNEQDQEWKFFSLKIPNDWKPKYYLEDEQKEIINSYGEMVWSISREKIDEIYAKIGVIKPEKIDSSIKGSVDDAYDFQLRLFLWGLYESNALSDDNNLLNYFNKRLCSLSKSFMTKYDFSFLCEDED